MTNNTERPSPFPQGEVKADLFDPDVASTRAAMKSLIDRLIKFLVSDHTGEALELALKFHIINHGDYDDPAEGAFGIIYLPLDEANKVFDLHDATATARFLGRVVEQMEGKYLGDDVYYIPYRQAVHNLLLYQVVNNLDS